ncbi:MAG: PatB family C-S lyase [Chloroflexota bacterium]
MTDTIPFNLDAFVNRRNSGCAKWTYFGDDAIPMWVADMDFPVAPAITEALQQRVSHGIFGYTMPSDDLKTLLVQRMKNRYNWDIQPDDIVYLPGVIPGINMTARAIAQDGTVMIQTPVYHPFYETGIWSGTTMQYVPLTYTETEDGFTYAIDFDAFEAAITPQTKLFLLCNPHNPIGRMWTAAELQRMGEICVANDVYICSDEIHCDLILDDRTHVPIATLAPEFAQRTVTLMAPSKTFNIPGLGFSFAIIQNPDLRRRFTDAGTGLIVMKFPQREMSFINMMGHTAAEAAYRDGQTWLDSVLDYLRANRDYARAYIHDYLQPLKAATVEGTYLLWIDCREANLPAEPGEFFREQANVAMNEGSSFGEDGTGFVRMNLACTRDTLKTALEQMRDALDAR